MDLVGDFGFGEYRHALCEAVNQRNQHGKRHGHGHIARHSGDLRAHHVNQQLREFLIDRVP